MCHGAGTTSRYDLRIDMPDIWKAALSFIAGMILARIQPVESSPDLDDGVELGDAFAFDVVARFNAGLVANVDAIDTGLTAILAGIVAVVVFTIDKVRELHELEKWVALGLLCCATFACVIGYLVGGPRYGFGNRDGVRPSNFVPDFVRKPEAATTNAIQQLMDASEANLTVRLRKRTLAMLALVLLLAGVAVVTAARLYGNVV